ncbi:MAG: filamentous hemagglutinin N-terminal domain-containing protein [Cyanobacteria bacterium P01_B01_bin.77]
MLGNRVYQQLLQKVSLVQVGLAVLLSAYPALAQNLVVPDGTLGAESSVVTDLDAVTQRIDGGASRGGNLFHSFLEFNVGEGEQVYFSTPGGTFSIFSRITGENPSAINGTLGVDGTANLFLMNPNGVMFGPNAQLDIEGSLTATTAENFIFDNGQMFGVTTPEIPSLLTVTDIPQVGQQIK